MTLNAYYTNLTGERQDGVIVLNGVTYEFNGSGGFRGAVFYIENKKKIDGRYYNPIWECSMSIENEKMMLKVYRDWYSDYKDKTVILYEITDKLIVA